jgi:oligoribonuclease
MLQDPNALIWIDLEMTGLDTANDKIIEVATIVTDSQLEIVAEGPVLAVHQGDEILNGMDEWNTKTHGKTGLIERVKASTQDEAEAERQTIAFLEQYVPKDKSPMCGNSICQDRRFLARTMPALEAFFHYRNLDVSSIKEMAKRWKPEILPGFSKKNTHKALDDIRESIEELKYYREHFIVKD